MTTSTATLQTLGWSPAFAKAFEPYAQGGQVPARVAVENRSEYGLYTDGGEAHATVTGKLRRDAAGRRDLPAVGDWVVLAPSTGSGPGQIHAVLPRTSVFTRKAPGREHEEQIVAANVDVVFIVTSLNAELNPRRIERYLTLAWESGARPVIVLSKSDRTADPAARASEIASVAGTVPVHVTSTKTGAGVDALLAHLSLHRTGALLGSSGVGKSALINALVGFERQSTGAIREADDKGRHTTTRRELVLLPGGGLIIDTPGMRELQLREVGHGLLMAFDDIVALARDCTFADCRHGPEPGCAVTRAVAEGVLPVERLDAFHKLVAELETRASWQDPRHGAGATRSTSNRSHQKRTKHRR